MIQENINKSCAVCYKIICKQCKWEASDAEVLLIQQEKLTACPVCGWKPSQNLRSQKL